MDKTKEIQQKMTREIEQVRAELDAKIPREAVSERSAGFGNKTLSYLEGHYVIDRLNQLFGPENWAKSIQATKTFEGTVNEKFYVSYIAVVTLTVAFPNGKVKVTQDVGFGDGQDGKNPGKTHELALKEAVTDGLKRCAKDLGMSMGLALYSKDQENVQDAEPAPAPKKVTPTITPAIVLPPPAVGYAPKLSIKVPDTKRLIKEAAKVAFTKNLVSVDKFRELLSTEYNAAKVDDLSDAQANVLYAHMKDTYKELALQ